MKRFNNLYQRIFDIDNLILAEKKARKGKTKQNGVIIFDKNKEQNLIELQNILINNEYKTSKYDIFTIFEGKERIIYKLPYYPDRITHHAIMNIIEPIFIKSFTIDTYSCIKNRGIHKALRNIKVSLKDIVNTQYCLKLDIVKFYPNVNNEILKNLLRRKFKDKKLLNLLDEIIESVVGLPIGNYLSQVFGNFYLTYFDHWIKEELKIKDYFRYCDDLVFLHSNKDHLHIIREKIQNYLLDNLKLNIKNNYQTFPINKRGLDFIGYKFYHTHISLRKSIKKNYINMIKYRRNRKSIASYHGWLCHANCINLENKYTYGKN